MKKVEVIIRPEKLDDMKEILDECSTTGAMVSNIMGYGNQKGYNPSTITAIISSIFSRN